MESPAHLTDTSFPMSCMRCNQLLHGVDRFCRHCGQDQLDADFDPWASRPAALGAPSRTAPIASFDWTPTPASAPAFASAQALAQEPDEPPGRTIAFTRLSIGLMAVATMALVAALTHDVYRTLQDDEVQRSEPGRSLQGMKSQPGNPDPAAAQHTLAMASPAAPGKLDVQAMRDPIERPALEPDDESDRVPEAKAMPMPVAASMPAEPSVAAFVPPSPTVVEAPLPVAAPSRATEALTDTARPTSCPDALAALALCPSR